MNTAAIARQYPDTPVYRFGSDDLAALHRSAKCSNGVYSWAFHGHRYIVDHGSHATLNTLLGGQVVPRMVDLPVPA